MQRKTRPDGSRLHMQIVPIRKVPKFSVERLACGVAKSTYAVTGGQDFRPTSSPPISPRTAALIHPSSDDDIIANSLTYRML